MMASQQASVDFMVKHRLKENYLRLDEVQSKEQERVLALDVATDTATRTILAIAEGTAQRAVNEPLFKAIAQDIAAEAVFYRPA